jgi:hypothetical protein
MMHPRRALIKCPLLHSRAQSTLAHEVDRCGGASVFARRVAMRRNALMAQNKLSARWRHLYFSASRAACPVVPSRSGMTASIFPSANRLHSQPASAGPRHAELKNRTRSPAVERFIGVLATSRYGCAMGVRLQCDSGRPEPPAMP